MCIKAIPQFTTQHVWLLWLVVFTGGYLRAQCEFKVCVGVCVCLYAFFFFMLDAVYHVSKHEKSCVGVCAFMDTHGKYMDVLRATA